MTNGGNKPKPAFYVAIAVVIVGLLGLAMWRCGAKKSADKKQDDKISIDEIKKQAGNDKLESEEGATGLTSDHFEEVEAQKLPEVKGTSDYKKLGAKRTVRMAINVWAGWAPIIWANQGKAPKKVWKDSEGKDFTLELVLIDDPSAMGDTFAAGDIHLGWATVDMLPLIVQRLNRDERTMPRVFQQIDWSNGGDGIVVRSDIKNVADLRGKTVSLAQNSPSHYFLLNALLNGGVQPSEVKMKFYADAFQAAAAFNANKDISACVSWAPDIYKLADVPGNKMLVNTLTANKLIADVWFARADFARDNMPILEALVRGFLDATTELSAPDADAKKQDVGKLMDDFYGLPAGSGAGMLADAHWTNYAENRDFFLNNNNPANFERTYNTAYLLYRAVRIVEDKVPPELIADPSIIKKLEKEEKYANSKNEYKFNFTPVAGADLNVESAILTKRVVIQFYPNSYEVLKKVPSQSGKDVYYDPNVENTIDEIARLAAQYGAARIEISGHTDSSMREFGADEKLVRELSTNRANAVKQELVNKYKLDPNQFVVSGYGWDKPADPSDPGNHAKNRRVEVKVIPAEAQ
jgi:NitT/TauT family transport system substrate-binding protein